MDTLPRDGALGYYDELQMFQWCNPRDPLFSTMIMIATHRWMSDEWNEHGKWLPISDIT